jgi:hypothetical protein
MNARQPRRANAPGPELRRWAVEQISAGAGLDTLKDASKICQLADALVLFVRTGDHPIDRPPMSDLH